MSKQKKYVELGIVWFCCQCGTYNLDAIDSEDFECINCRYIIRAFAGARLEEVGERGDE